MREKTIFLFLILLIISCSDSSDIDGTFEDLNSVSKPIKFVNKQSFSQINPTTFDTIKPIISGNGDTLVTGAPFKVQAKSIDTSELERPTSFPADIKAFLNKDKTTDVSEKGVISNYDYEAILNEKPTYLITKEGDTLETNKAFYIAPKISTLRNAKPIRAKGFYYKKNARIDIKLLDINNDRLSFSGIQSIIQARTKEVWMGNSENGILRFDGTYYYPISSKEGLPNNEVSKLFEDSKGNIWIGFLETGFCKFDGNTFAYYNFLKKSKRDRITDIIEDNAGNIWISSANNGLIKMHNDSLTVFTKNEGLLSNKVNSIVKGMNDKIWIGTLGGLCVFNGRSFSKAVSDDGALSDPIWDLVKGEQDELWMASSKWIIKMSSTEISKYRREKGVATNDIQEIIYDSKGNLWITTFTKGVSRFDGKYFYNYSIDNGLSNNLVQSVMEDQSGNLWFGTMDDISIINIDKFRSYSTQEGLSNNIVLGMLSDNKNNIWFGTGGGGISFYDNTQFYKVEAEGLQGEVIFDIIQDKQSNIWFTSIYSGIFKFDGESFTNYNTKQGLSANAVLCAFESKNGDLWFGTKNKGVTRFSDGKVLHYKTEQGLPNNWVQCIVEDYQGNIWIATKGGLTKFDGENFTNYSEKEGLPDNEPYTVFEDSRQLLWIGTKNGLAIYNGKTFYHINSSHGLIENTVCSIIEDDQNDIWLSSNKGITEITFNGLHEDLSIENFTSEDGLQSPNHYTNSVIKDSRGKIWWGAGNNVVMINAKNAINETSELMPALRRLDIDGRFLDYSNLLKEENNGLVFDKPKDLQNTPQNLVLAHYKNHLTFYFTAINWEAPHKVKYSYMLEGWDSNWSIPSNKTNVDYRNISPGSYVFKIKALNTENVWSTVSTYQFKISPPWYLSWWAYALWASLIILIFYSVLRWRTYQLKARQKELEKEIEMAIQTVTLQKEKVEKQKSVIEEAHKEITDSISYAKRIQLAILPTDKSISSSLKNSFVLYKPKDIVAGDFYWMEIIDNRVLFAVADCTGHGVPGAMVSVVCNGALNRSVREFGLTDPGKILDQARKIVIQEFEKSEEDVKDGMDIAMCALEGRKLQYSGAYNPLWIIRNGELLETKANKQPIGKFDRPEPYTTHSFELEKDDTIYLFSDGYFDQFGGELDKKYKSGRFKKFIQSIQKHPMNVQKELLNNEFESWRGTTEQVDDVCIIGVKI